MKKVKEKAGKHIPQPLFYYTLDNSNVYSYNKIKQTEHIFE